MRRELLQRIIRFGAAGVVNTIIGVSLFAIASALIANHRIAAFVSAVVAILIAHTLTGRLVFGSRGWGTLPAYVAAYAVIGLVNAVLIDVGVRLGLAPLLAQVAAVPFVAMASFLINVLLVFRERRGPGKSETA